MRKNKWPKRWRIHAFELWCWRRLLRVHWTARRSNQSMVKEISSGCSLEGLMLKLKYHTLATWCKELTYWKRPWFWERLRAGGEGDNRRWDGWMASPTQWTWVWVDYRSWWWTGRSGVLWLMGLQRVEHGWATELNWNLNSRIKTIKLLKENRRKSLVRQWYVRVYAQSLQWCPTFCDPKDQSLSGSSVHWILQARILKWVTMPSSRGSSWPKDITHVSCVSWISGTLFTTESPRKPQAMLYKTPKARSN